jgi:hypothetical protein
VHAPGGEAPEQEAVDGAECELPAPGALARARNLVEQPGDLRAGEIGVEQEARALADEQLRAVALESRTAVRRAAVLPDDRAMDRPARAAFPDDGRLALIRDADGRDALCADAGLLDGLARRQERVAPDVLGIVLDPAGRRVVLQELAPRERGLCGPRRRTRCSASRSCPGRWRADAGAGSFAYAAGD